MKYGTRCPITVVVCWVLTVQGANGYLSDNELDFMTVFSGYHDNAAQIEAKKINYDYIIMTCRAVRLPALFKGIVLFTEWSYDGVVLNLNLNEVMEDKHGVIFVTIHNFTDPRKYKPATYNPDDLYKIKPEDLSTVPGCIGAFDRVGRGVYLGTWPECRYPQHGKYPMYSGLLNCDNTIMKIPLAAKERTVYKAPYVLKLKGARYPLLDIRPGYTSPCD